MADTERDVSDTRHDWRQSTCVFCSHQDCGVVLARSTYDIRRCPRCSVMWCDPMRSDQGFHGSDEAAYLGVTETIVSENARRLKTLQEFAPSATHPRAVEIGCMHGDFVRQMRDVGYEGGGLDLSQSAVDIAAEGNPGCVRYGTLDETVESGSLDVVAAFNVIEHMDAPHEFLDEVARVLRPGGVLILETPQQESLYHYASFLQGRFRPEADGVEVGLYPGTHIFKFGRRAWTKILADRPFRIRAKRPKSTPLAELLKKKTTTMSLATRAAIVVVGGVARVTRLDNRLLVVAQRT